jgi:hypothetical protein
VSVGPRPGFHGIGGPNYRKSPKLIGRRADDFCIGAYVVGDRKDDVRVAHTGLQG